MEFKTERLHMRPITRDDFDRVHSMFGDPVVMQHYPSTFDRERTAEIIERSCGYQERDGTGFYGLYSKDDDRFLGQCGLLWHELDGVEELEIGYQLLQSAWGHGYAAEAGLELRRYGFETIGQDHIISIMRPSNLPSQATARRLGMTMWKTTLFRGLVCHVFRIDRAV